MVASNDFYDDSEFTDAIAAQQPINQNYELGEFESFLDDNFVCSNLSVSLASSTLTGSAIRDAINNSLCVSMDIDQSGRSSLMHTSIAIDESNRSNLFQSNCSSVMTFEIDDLAKSLESISFNLNNEEQPHQQNNRTKPIDIVLFERKTEEKFCQECVEPIAPEAAPRRRRNGHGRSNSPKRSFKINQVDFDPSPYKPDMAQQGCGGLNDSFTTAKTSNIVRAIEETSRSSSESSLEYLVFPSAAVEERGCIYSNTREPSFENAYYYDNFPSPVSDMSNSSSNYHTPIANNSASSLEFNTPVVDNSSAILKLRAHIANVSKSSLDLQPPHAYGCKSSRDAQTPKVNKSEVSGTKFNRTACKSENENTTSSPVSAVPLTPEEYNAALEKLAQSMKRTEASRQHLLQHREELEAAKREILLDQQRSIAMAQFLSGSRSTLTGGLEQSRRQIASYMGNMNHQTF
mmetsp:Transcript_9127/g.19494  ORF Transcript_9127/g.19494 Transcript_9127/m.19494 type:complete len:461 (+) Transcript_9127:178-1560(+)